MAIRVGILALQGDFAAHRRKFQDLGCSTLLIKNCSKLEGIDALVLPGGESTTMLRLLQSELKTALLEFVQSNSPVYATCAGLILLAKNVTHPEQGSLGALDIDIIRNGYGRQVDSFIARRLDWTDAGLKAAAETGAECAADAADLEAVFIRAPQISRLGQEPTILACCNGWPVLIRQGRVLGSTFHPELSENRCVERLFLQIAANAPV